jgi:hypothetical protein
LKVSIFDDIDTLQGVVVEIHFLAAKFICHENLHVGLVWHFLVLEGAISCFVVQLSISGGISWIIKVTLECPIVCTDFERDLVLHHQFIL